MTRTAADYATWSENVATLSLSSPPLRWRLTMVPGVVIQLPSAPNRFHRWTLGLLFGFRWERLS